MSAASRLVAAGSILCLGLAACGGGTDEEPIYTDYTALRVAESEDSPLFYARSEEEVLRPLRNGMRMMVSYPIDMMPADLAVPSATSQLQHSITNVQVQGVDEADSVKYDGRYIYAVRPQVVIASNAHVSRNVLSISRTDPVNALVEPISNYVIPGEQSTSPQLYQLPTHEGTAEYLVAVSQNYQSWYGIEPLLTALVVNPDRTTIQLLDVRDPHHVSESWRIELDGWMRASRLSGDTLYVVNSYSPRLANLVSRTSSLDAPEINERRIRSASARELLPGMRENGGQRHTLAFDGCLLPQNLESHHGYLNLIVITAINVRTRRVTDVNCLSTNVNAVYVSRDSLYVSGLGWRPQENVPITVLHKFSIEDGDITYRATGSVAGTVGWRNPSYFMDEHDGDLRILTTAQGTHHLSVLRESGSQSLMTIAKLPNAGRPDPIGKPGEAVFAIRFMGARAYVVTFRTIDPLYVLDLRDPADPLIAGELEIPGFSTYLHPLGATQSEFLLAVGRNVVGNDVFDGIKVELFDVRDLAHPQSVATEVFGRTGSTTEALDDPHALAILALPGAEPGYRVGVPAHVFDGEWKYSGLHLFQIAAGAAPQLHFQGVLKTEQVGAAVVPSFSGPNRGILHGESVFAIQGLTTVSSLWQNVPQP